ncbi:MAG TPA: GGDEF domain-containing protein [Kofleriaceae bacterium]|nr:GGDEF domain-containing protein [Kofleriaceae bacterium]
MGADPKDWDEVTNVVSISGVHPLPAGDRQRAYLIVLMGANVGEMFPIEPGEVVIGRSNRAQIRIVDDGISRAHARISIRGDEVFIEDLDSRNGTFIGGEPLTGTRKLANGDKIQLAGKVVLRLTYGDSLDESFQQAMYDSSLRDGLTGAFNKRYFNERLDSEYKYAERHREPLTLMMLDIDHFKPVNDEHGHMAGDHVLKLFATAMMSSVRNEDVFARYGGEEFAIISRAIPAESARVFAERLRRAAERLGIEYEGKHIPLTVSIGVATYPDAVAASAVDLLSAADRALYWAKEAGRNRIAVYSPDAPEEDTRPT